MRATKPFAALFACAALLNAGAAVAGEYDDALKALVDERLRAIAAEPALIEAVRSQNADHEGLAADKIDAMDKTWRAEVGAADAPMIAKVSSKPASERLVEIRDGGEGLFTEIFVMDDKGLNVAVSDVTSDYWQGDEAKWQETFGAGAAAVHISDVELDESTQTYQSQVSLTVVDPENGAPIGAITFGVNVEYLE